VVFTKAALDDFLSFQRVDADGAVEVLVVDDAELAEALLVAAEIEEVVEEAEALEEAELIVEEAEALEVAEAVEEIADADADEENAK
jgi:hypothetical protein